MSLYRYYMSAPDPRPAVLSLGAPLYYNTGIPSAPDQPAPNAVKAPVNVPAATTCGGMTASAPQQPATNAVEAPVKVPATPAAVTGGGGVTAPAPGGPFANNRASYVRPATRHPLAPNVLSKSGEDVQALASGSVSTDLRADIIGIPAAEHQTNLSTGPLRGDVPAAMTSTSTSHNNNQLATASPTRNAIRPTGALGYRFGNFNDTNSAIPRRRTRLTPYPPSRTSVTNNNAAALLLLLQALVMKGALLLFA